MTQKALKEVLHYNFLLSLEYLAEVSLGKT